jgi:outer membrane protein assembly factor BamB
MSISQGRLYAMGNTDATDTVFCLDANTGAVLWKHSYPCPLDPNLYEGGPNATPTVDAGRVYTLSKHGHLFAFEATSGKILWQKNLVSDFGLKKPEWGFSSSAVAEGDLLVLNAGGSGTAIKKASGDLAWTSPGAAAYPTPLPINLEGTRAAIFLARDSLVTVSVGDGKLLWSTPWKTRYDMGVPDAVAYKDKVYVSSWGEPGTLFAFKDGKGVELWRNKEMWQHVSMAVIIEDYLYGFHGDTSKGHEFKCLDARTGEIKWSQDNLPNGGLTAANGKLIILTGRGELVIAEASPAGFHPLARVQVLEGKCWTMPVLANGKLYCRNAKGDLVCLDLQSGK